MKRGRHGRHRRSAPGNTLDQSSCSPPAQTSLPVVEASPILHLYHARQFHDEMVRQSGEEWLVSRMKFFQHLLGGAGAGPDPG